MGQSTLSSFKAAIHGMRHGLTRHRNAKIMLCISAVVIALGFHFHFVRFEWAVICVCIGLVLGLELLNTAIETLLDHLHPEQHKAIGLAKDIAAGAVLWASICAALAGIFIFWPHIMY